MRILYRLPQKGKKTDGLWVTSPDWRVEDLCWLDLIADISAVSGSNHFETNDFDFIHEVR